VESAPSEDDIPIVVNLPDRQDPTKVQVSGAPAGVTAVEPLTLANAAGMITRSIPTLPHPIVQTPATAQAETADSAEDDTTPKSLPLEVQVILQKYGVAAWKNTDDPQKPYWSLRQGPRSGAIRDGAPAVEWEGRCASISVGIRG
jgi:hypothetical protein